PRVTFLATGRQGWAAVCRLVSATHLAGERGDPVCTLDLVAEHAAGRGVVALLGPASELGAAATVRREDLARVVLRQWQGPAGVGERGARALLAHTRVVADRCALDPRSDLGLGEVHLPELGVTARTEAERGAGADQVLRGRCEVAIGHRYGSSPRQRIWKRLD